MTTSDVDAAQPSAAARVWTDPDQAAEVRLDALLAEMTLEEKLGQLGSKWLGFARENSANVGPMQDAFAATTLSFEEASRHGLGHITRAFGTAPVTVAQGTDRVVSMQSAVVENTRLGIPAIVHEECLTGFSTLGATVYPAPIAWAATFDLDLVELMASAIGSDMRAVGAHQGLSPVLDVVRDYRWGRVEETLGEDPYLVGMMGTAYVRGLEGNGIVATLKHFAGYSASRAGRNHAPVSMGVRELRDMILPPFEMAIREGRARSVMNSYSDVDGVPAAADRSLLTGILRDEWGFDGVVVSDYWAISFLRNMHRVAASDHEAGALALAAGLDVELPDTNCYNSDLLALIRGGSVPEALLDRSVRRVLRQKLELSLLDRDWTPEGSVRDKSVDLDSPSNRAIARDLAERSIILLANDGILPLAPAAGQGRSIALIGPCADDPLTFMGCYSYPNHILQAHPEFGMGISAPSLLDALRAEFPGVSIAYEEGVPIRDIDRSGMEAAIRVASAADLCVLAVGDKAGLFGRGTSGEGCDVLDLRLPGLQGELVERVLATGTPVVLVVVSGRPYALGAYASTAASIVQVFMPGEEGGQAIAGILSGRLIPTGKLPVQIPAYPGAQPSTYLQPPLGADSAGISSLDPTPLYPFGHGLSYTRYRYTNLRLSSREVPTDGLLAVSITLTNSGDRAGEEIVQLYLHDAQAQVARPLRQLAGFKRVALEPGAAVELTFAIHADRTAFTGLDGTRLVEPGDFEVLVGRSATDIPLTGNFRLTGPTRQVGHDRVMTTPVTVTVARPG